MCGRFTLTLEKKALEQVVADHYGLSIDASTLAVPRYNIAPGQRVIALIHDGTDFRIGTLLWGMPAKGRPERMLVNARAETLSEKPSFKTAFQHHRCLILADGYYEWQNEGTKKTPMRISLHDRTVFAMAGIYAPYEESNGAITYRCAIVTTEANPDVVMIHHRMPLILSPSKETPWVHPVNHAHTKTLKTLLGTPKKGMLEYYPVDSIVNNPTNDSEACIRPASDASVQSLF